MPEHRWIYQRTNTTASQQRKQWIIFMAPRKEIRYQYVKCLILWAFVFPHASNFIIETEHVAYRASSTIHPSSKLELLCQCKMTFWHYIVIKSSIIDDLGVRYPPLVCLFSITKSTCTCSKLGTRSALKHGLKSVQSYQLKH